MNDLQKMLQLNIDDIEPENVTKIERKRLFHSILKRKKRRYLHYAVAVGVLTCGMGSSVLMLSPTIAAQIPIIQNIVDYFNGETTQFKYFDDYATIIGSMQTSNSVTIEIADAIYDGTTVTIAFAIESKKDLGEHPVFSNPIVTNGNVEGGSVTSLKKVTNTTYAGVITVTPELNGRSPRTVSLSWSPGSIWNHETDEIIEGDWSFEFKLKKINVEGIPVNYTDIKNDFALNVPFVDITGYTINIPFELKMPSKYMLHNLPYTIDFEIKDELGNEYEMITNGANSTAKHVAEGSYTVANLQSGARVLTITPKLVDENKNINFDSFTVNIPTEVLKKDSYQSAIR
ncbi:MULTISPECIES: DUF4179 domain-containing protein [Bacilli]|nr:MULTISPECIES: DUF4179 domain-containing protein [Bacilli]MDT2688429.1 DUF4179 domain-containing protein [Enterococcus gallinarum]MDT2706928.1 DUF4179 domain-containing protein [Enterococcus dispar]QMU12147.1 DUF4179 domain-containing protein [Mammaliicoccus lentus]